MRLNGPRGRDSDGFDALPSAYKVCSWVDKDATFRLKSVFKSSMLLSKNRWMSDTTRVVWWCNTRFSSSNRAKRSNDASNECLSNPSVVVVVVVRVRCAGVDDDDDRRRIVTAVEAAAAAFAAEGEGAAAALLADRLI